MPAIRYLLFVVILACFLIVVNAVTDQEFQEFSNMVKERFDRQEAVISQQAVVNDQQATLISRQAETIERLTHELKQLRRMVMDPNQEQFFSELVQNTTIEERVTLLELQMTDVQADITGLDQDVNFLFEEQIIQDEALLNLEERMLNVEMETVQINEDIEGLQVATLELDFRVTELEENGGSDGNSSVSELEERVETLEGSVADHETRLTAVEGEIEDVEGSVAEQETRLTAAEEYIQGLQATDISLDARITALEENGGGSSNNETIAFSAVLTSYDTIGSQDPVEFNEILLNEGNGYNNTTGVFTVPSGGGGLYFFSTYLLVQNGEYAYFDMRLNDAQICTAYSDMNTNGASDTSQAGCSVVVIIQEGDEVKIVQDGASDDTPLGSDFRNGFNGFRI